MLDGDPPLDHQDNPLITQGKPNAATKEALQSIKIICKDQGEICPVSPMHKPGFVHLIF